MHPGNGVAHLRHIGRQGVFRDLDADAPRCRRDQGHQALAVGGRHEGRPRDIDRNRQLKPRIAPAPVLPQRRSRHPQVHLLHQPRLGQPGQERPWRLDPPLRIAGAQQRLAPHTQARALRHLGLVLQEKLIVPHAAHPGHQVLPAGLPLLRHHDGVVGIEAALLLQPGEGGVQPGQVHRGGVVALQRTHRRCIDTRPKQHQGQLQGHGRPRPLGADIGIEHHRGVQGHGHSGHRHPARLHGRQRQAGVDRRHQDEGNEQARIQDQRDAEQQQLVHIQQGHGQAGHCQQAQPRAAHPPQHGHHQRQGTARAPDEGKRPQQPRVERVLGYLVGQQLDGVPAHRLLQHLEQGLQRVVAVNAKEPQQRVHAGEHNGVEVRPIGIDHDHGQAPVRQARPLLQQSQHRRQQRGSGDAGHHHVHRVLDVVDDQRSA